MKREEAILAETPVNPVLGGKIALVCVQCPWWTNHASKAKREKDDEHLYCGNCGAHLQDTPLEELIEGTRTANPNHFEGFLQWFSDNRPEKTGVS